MWSINNDTDLRASYEILRLMEAREEKNDTLVDLIIIIKRDIRQYVNRPIDESRIVKEYGINGADVIVPLPISPEWNEHAAIEYFEDNLYIYSPESAYDCTGRAFTSWFKVFKRHGRWYAFHAIRYDV